MLVCKVDLVFRTSLFFVIFNNRHIQGKRKMFLILKNVQMLLKRLILQLQFTIRIFVIFIHSKHKKMFKFHVLLIRLIYYYFLKLHLMIMIMIMIIDVIN